LPEYLEIFQNAGFEIIVNEYAVLKDKEELNKFQGLRIHHDFENFSFDELTASSLKIVLRKQT